MGNVIKTDEVYKKKSAVYKNKDTGNAYGKFENGEIVSVRGVYVSGEYRPPYYNNPAIKLENVQCVKPTIVDYTTKEQDVNPPTSILSFYNIYQQDPLDIVDYKTRSQDVNPPTSILSFYNIYQQDPLDIVYYGDIKKDANPPSSILTFYDIFPQDPFEIIFFKSEPTYESRGEPILRLMPVDCKKAEIENKIL